MGVQGLDEGPKQRTSAINSIGFVSQMGNNQRQRTTFVGIENCI
jgi:hypothetical protein